MSKGIIGISTAEQGRYSDFYAFLSGLRRPEGSKTIFSLGSVISENRNRITQATLDQGFDWVLYLDDDHILPPDTLTKLLAADRNIISAHYVQRQPRFNSVLMDAELPDGSFTSKQLHPKEYGILPVAAVGAGCLLVKRIVLEALKPPYWTLGQIDPANWGDDLHFCSRVRKAGFDIFCDLGAPIGHIITGVVWPERSEEHGWQVNFAKEMRHKPLAKWNMPLPGEL